MIKRKIRSLCELGIFIIALCFGASVLAHHSFEAHFDSSESTTIQGVVTEFWFANPHARIYLEVVNQAGEVEEWMVEGGSRNNLIRQGWQEDTITPGMSLVITGSSSRNGSNSVGGWNNMTTPDGSEVVLPRRGGF